jgi:hypothetical protein
MVLFSYHFLANRIPTICRHKCIYTEKKNGKTWIILWSLPLVYEMASPKMKSEAVFLNFGATVVKVSIT